MKKKFLFFLIPCFVFATCKPSCKPSLLSFGVGAFDIRKDKNRTALFLAEYKWNKEWYTVRPMVGGMATVCGAFYLYGGFGLDWVFCDHFLFSPNFAAGYYHQGGGKDLGYELEFRSGIEAAYIFCNQSRLGLHFYHISNASLRRKNPGEESLVLFYAIPIW